MRETYPGSAPKRPEDQSVQRFVTPKNPIHKDGVWHCPNCNSRVGLHHSYCHHCGQSLKWG